MAAALLAALFAMGVFAPAGVEAGVKASPATEITLDNIKPEADEVTVTVKFQVNDEVDGSRLGDAGTDDNIVVTLSGLTELDFDNVKVMQGTREVGGVMIKNAGGSDITAGTTVTITTPNAMSTETPPASIVRSKDTNNGNLLANTDTTLTITGLTNPASGTAATVAIHQFPATSAPSLGNGFKSFTVGPSVTSASASVDKVTAGAEEVKLTLTFQADSHSTGATDNPVTIKLPVGYDLATDDGIAEGATTPTDAVIAVDAGYTGSTADNISVSPSTVMVTTTTTDNPGSAPVVEAGETLTVHTFGTATSNPIVTITIRGLTNPSSTESLGVEFLQTAAAVEDADETQKTPMVYITDAEEISLARENMESTLSKADANADNVTMTFMFESVVSVDEDTSIMVDLHDDFGGFSTGNVEVMQDDAEGDAQSVSMVTRAPGTNAFYISEDEDGDNVMPGDVTVTISGLTNPDMVGTLNRAIVVKQGDFAAVAASFSLQGADISTNSPGADVRVEISTSAGATIPGGDDIMVTLDGFGIPETIEASDVIIQTDRNINPSDISVDGDEVTLSLPTTIGETTNPYNIMGAYSIIFKQGAGLTNPTSGGNADITVSDMDSMDHEMTVTIDSSVSVKPSFVTRGDDATVTAKGLEDGTATVHLGGRSGTVVGSGTAADGVVEIVIDTSDLKRGATRDGDSDKGANTLYVKDASNDVVGSTSIGIKPKISLGSDSVKRSGKLEITVSDWYYGDINRVAIGGVEVSETTGSDTISVGSDYKETFKVTVPASVRFGKQEVKVEGSNPDRLKTFSVTDEVTVDALAINISPSTVVPGSQITITGSGYVKNTEVQEIMIGEEPAELPDEQDDREATSAGRIAYTITVPLGVGNGDMDVQVTVGTGSDERVGVGEITVPKPSIELDPATSVPGSVISVNGTGFASSGRVEVRYKDAIEEVGRADSSGSFHIRLEIPSDAGVGAPGNEVKVEVRGTPSINATADHKTPGSAIMVPETAQVGTLVTISGTNFEPFSNLDVRIGGKDATPSPGPETDKNGAFEFETRVPRLAAGSHTVTVMDAEDNSVSETFSVVTSPVVSTPEEVFGVLGDSLVSVWSLDNATKAWSAYFPGAPEGVSDLTGVSRGDIVWVNVSADVAFQGGMLTTGWNLISLE